MRRIHLHKSFISSPIAFIYNLALVYIVYGLCRLAYLFENWAVISEGFDQLDFWEAFKGCWMFDTSAILYTNALYAILMLIPLHYKEKNWWQTMTKWVYVEQHQHQNGCLKTWQDPSNYSTNMYLSGLRSGSKKADNQQKFGYKPTFLYFCSRFLKDRF